MKELDLFTYGWVNPVLAVAMSGLGCLLALMLSIKARARPRRGRGRLLGYATAALAGIAIFQAHFVAVLGIGVGRTALRYDPLTLLLGLCVALGSVGAGLLLVSVGRATTVRLAVSSVLIGLGITSSHYVTISAIRGVGFLYYEPMHLAGSVALGLLTGCAALWFVVSLRGLRSAFLAASIAAAGICGTHYAAMSALQPRPTVLVAVNGSLAGGVAPMLLVGPVVLLGAAVTAMLWFFTVGTSTMDDLHMIFEMPEHSVEIEQWMIDEVTTRIANGYQPPVSLLTVTRAAPDLTSTQPQTAAPSKAPTTTNLSPAAHRERNAAKATVGRNATRAPRPRSTSDLAAVWGEPAAVASPNLDRSVPLDRYPPGYDARARNRRSA